MSVPDSLESPLSFFRHYLDDPPDLPFIAIVHPGSGAVEFMSRVVEQRNFRPRVVYENEEVPPIDFDEHRLFPFYDLPKPEPPATTPSVLIVPPGFNPKAKDGKADFSKSPFATFQPPTLPEREAYLRQRKAPLSLAEGNPDYDSLRHAVLAWEVAGVELRAEPERSSSWDGFRDGGPPPVPEPLLPYYAAYAFPPEETWPNRNIGWMRRAPSFVARLLMDEIRLAWPRGKVDFPTILKEPNPRAAQSHSPKEVVASGKNYAISWD